MILWFNLLTLSGVEFYIDFELNCNQSDYWKERHQPPNWSILNRICCFYFCSAYNLIISFFFPPPLSQRLWLCEDNYKGLINLVKYSQDYSKAAWSLLRISAGFCTRKGQLWLYIQPGRWDTGKQPHWKRFGGPSWQQAEHELTVCPDSQEGQQFRLCFRKMFLTNH